MTFKEKIKAKKEIAQIDLQLKEIHWLPNQRKLMQLTRVLAELSYADGYAKVLAFDSDKQGIDDALASSYVNKIRDVVE